MQDLTMAIDWALIAVAAFAAGVLNAVAGGGSFLTFPALVFIGLPPIVANATSAVAVAPGYLGGVIGFRRELKPMARDRLVQEAAVCAIGGVVGAALLIVTPASVFSAIVPWLLIFATGLFALAPSLRKVVGHSQREHGENKTIRFALLALVAIYGGYFNGGLGVLLMALYSLTGPFELNSANALKSLGSFVLSVTSVLTFAWAGAVAWPQAIVMMLAATAGGYWGADLARRLPERWIRAAVIGTGVVMAAIFYSRQ